MIYGRVLGQRLVWQKPVFPEARVTQARVTEAHLASGSSVEELGGDKSSSETQAHVTEARV